MASDGFRVRREANTALLTREDAEPARPNEPTDEEHNTGGNKA